MRIATFVVVIALHAVLFFLFAADRNLTRQVSEQEAPTILVFLPTVEPTRPVEPELAFKPPPLPARAARRAAPKKPVPASPAPEPESSSTIPTPAPDWREQARIAANDELEAEVRRRQNPSPLAPHDFSAVRPGSTDDSKPQFAWNHARTHPVEELPGGGLVININDRCAVVMMFIFPFPACKIGKMPARSDLFEHMQEVPAPAAAKVP